jgi:putative holliday junction resolvase
MGFDFGQKRIGVAIGQQLTGTASALGIVSARDGKPNWSELDSLIREWQPELFVVGLPLNMDDSMSDIAIAAQRFARRIEARYQIGYAMMDERLSTFDARLQSDKENVDAIAAQLILESWLREQVS